MSENKDMNLIPVFRAALESVGVNYDKDEFTVKELTDARAALRYVDLMIKTAINEENEKEEQDAVT